MKIEHKQFCFEVKTGDLQEDGSFIGLASTYGNIDQGDDVVDRGAFTKTLKERGSEVPLLWSHDSKQPVGLGTLEDSPKGLVVNGKLNLETQVGRDAYSNIKARIVKGLSIGFETINKKMNEGVRHLTELKLFEVSLCLFPMNEQAEVFVVKAREQKDDFLEELDEAQTWAFRYQSCDALMESLCETIADEDMDDAAKAKASSISIMQFHDKYLEMLPKMIAVMAERQSEYGYMSRPESEAKAGRKLSAASRKRIEESVSALQALLVEAADTSTSDGAAMPPGEPKANSFEPDLFHSLLTGYTKSITENMKCLN